MFKRLLNWYDEWSDDSKYSFDIFVYGLYFFISSLVLVMILASFAQQGNKLSEGNLVFIWIITLILYIFLSGILIGATLQEWRTDNDINEKEQINNTDTGIHYTVRKRTTKVDKKGNIIGKWRPSKGDKQKIRKFYALPSYRAEPKDARLVGIWKVPEPLKGKPKKDWFWG